MSGPGAPVAGTVVLSVGHTLPGLYCLALLRDLGAEVVRSPVRLPLSELPTERPGAQLLARFGFTRAEIEAAGG